MNAIGKGERGRRLALAALLVGPLAVLAADGGVSTERLESVQRLLESSSAARQIEASGNPAALAGREKARDLYLQARAARARGEDARAGELLGEATRTMFEAVRLVELDPALIEKKEHDFEDRLQSITALCDAYDRIRREKNLGPAEESSLYPLVQRKLDEAKGLRTEGRPEDGRRVLDEAYAAAKVAIEQLRGGETLVRELAFASKEEEYHYEIDRNDTHRMLVDVLLREKISVNPGMASMVERFMDKAGSLREQAERQAARGEFEQAVRTLEDSTREVVRAIRSAGIFIPG